MDTQNIHPIKITFDIPVDPGVMIKRFVYSYVLECEHICLIDTGVAGSDARISDTLQKIGKTLSDIDAIILTHSHPDHIGAASLIKRLSGAKVYAHAAERAWIEDVEQQAKDRPVPGFSNFVSGSVVIDQTLEDGNSIPFGNNEYLEVLHTPGHSSGSISLLSRKEGILFTGDVIPQPGGMPVYEDVCALANSLTKLLKIKNLTALYSSWADPLYGEDTYRAIQAGIDYLKAIHETVTSIDAEHENIDTMEFCKRCVQRLGLPPHAANPLVAQSLTAHRDAHSEKGRTVFSFL